MHSRCISVSIRVLVPNFNVHFGVDKNMSPQQSVENLTALMASGVFRNVICVTGKEISYWKNLYFLYWHLMFWVIHIMPAVLILSIHRDFSLDNKQNFTCGEGPPAIGRDNIHGWYSQAKDMPYLHQLLCDSSNIYSGLLTSKQSPSVSLQFNYST